MTKAWCDTDVINGNKPSVVGFCFDQQLSMRSLRESVIIIDKISILSLIISTTACFGLPGKVCSSLQTERTWSSCIHCCCCWTSDPPLMALNACTPSMSPSHWQTTDKCHVFVSCANNFSQVSLTKKHFFTLQKTFSVTISTKKGKSWKLFCVDTSMYRILRGSYFEVVDGLKLWLTNFFCSKLMLGLLHTTDLCKEWTIPQNILSLAQHGAGDSCLHDICTHFLRKSMRKLNRMNRIKLILCHILYGVKRAVVCNFLLLTCCPCGTIKRDRRCRLSGGSILTIPERDSCGFGAVMSSTRTNLNTKLRIKK